MTDTATTIETDETPALIASDKVEGTAVYSEEGEKLGSVHNMMIDKRSGEVSYVVMKFGGFMGLGTDFYPLPWEALTYNVDKGGYVVNVDKATLQNAPRYSGDEPAFDRSYGEQIYGAYGLSYPV